MASATVTVEQGGSERLQAPLLVRGRIWRHYRQVRDGWRRAMVAGVGKIVGVQGLQGELRVNPASDFPERFTEPGPRWLRSRKG